MPSPNAPKINPSSSISKGKARAPPSSSNSPSPTTEMLKSASRTGTDMQEEIARRERATRILGSWELLAWYSASFGESIPQTRLRFQKEMIGLETSSEEELEIEVDEVVDKGKGKDKTDGSGSGGGKGKGKRKGTGAS